MECCVSWSLVVAQAKRMRAFRWLCWGLSILSMATTTFAAEQTWQEPQKRIAYAVSVTHDGPYMDGAAVLAHAIRKAHGKSRYEYDLIAFVHPNVRTSREPLKRAGWSLLMRQTPIDLADIRGDFLRADIAKNGCCGAAELLKLYAWTMTKYHRVVHLDMDSLVLANMDELFEYDADLVYTCDEFMRNDQTNVCPVQGGFLLVRPDRKVFDELIDVVVQGDFRDASGWGGTGIGWWWGGATIQGLLPYYFEHLKQGKRSIQVDDCIYNNMAGRDWCKAVAKPYIKNVHFTFCMKPWDCWLWPEDHYCAYFTARWFELRAEVELAATGYAPSDAIDRCRTGKYEPITYLQATPSQSSDW